MQPSIAQTILQDRLIAYAITDRRLRVVEVGGATSIFLDGLVSWQGCTLTDVAPELIGNETALDDVLRGELPRFQLEWVNRELPEGQTAYLIMVDLPWRDAAGQIAGLIHLVQDLTHTGQLEQRIMQHRNELRLLQAELQRQNVQLAAANIELKQLDELRTAFVSIAAHELRTPLTSIQGYLEMLLDGDAGLVTERQADYLRIIDSSAQRLLHITRDLLDLTRLEAGRLELVLQTTDLRALVESVAVEQAPQFVAKAQHLIVQAPEILPPVLCDPTRAAQIIGNLLNNASKYSSAHSDIALTLAPAAEEGFVQLSVADQGIGIRDEDQARLFTPFFRASGQTKSGITGTGLGLYIARSLIELHGGRIWLESRPQQGSTFFVTLPQADNTASPNTHLHVNH